MINTLDLEISWTLTVVGGAVCVPQLGLRPEGYRSGSILLVRGDKLLHYTAPYKGECRTCFVLTTHQSVRDEVEARYPKLIRRQARHGHVLSDLSHRTKTIQGELSEFPPFYNGLGVESNSCSSDTENPPNKGRTPTFPAFWKQWGRHPWYKPLPPMNEITSNQTSTKAPETLRGGV